MAILFLDTMLQADNTYKCFVAMLIELGALSWNKYIQQCNPRASLCLELTEF